MLPIPLQAFALFLVSLAGLAAAPPLSGQPRSGSSGAESTGTAPGSAAELPTIGMSPGEMFPDLRLPDLEGKAQRISDLRGKKVLLIHFASW